jgi:hypothetical protein
MDQEGEVMAASPQRKQTGGSVAVLIPCYNEGLTIAKVVADMRSALPRARIYVYDNNSSDDTVAKAQGAGALVRSERNQGKGNVVRRMFADVEADVYLMLDGDGTYDSTAAPELARLVLQEGLDFVNGARQESSHKAYRTGHKFGNRMLTGLVQRIFGYAFDDMLSGYKAFSRRFVKSFPALSQGFEIETELAIHALELRMPTREIVTRYDERPEGSVSKLRTYRDGTRILLMIMRLVKQERPLQLFVGIGAVLILLAVVLAVPLLITYGQTGLVPRFPTAILCTGLALLGAGSFCIAAVLDGILTARRELKRIAYLGVPQYGARQDASAG